MTQLTVKALTLITLVFGISSQAAKADVDLTDGIRPFICDGETVVLVETNAGWLMPTDPTAELVRTKSGWRHEDRSSGQVWYLKEEEQNSWIVEMLSEDGYLKFDCVDIAQSVSEVVTIIKPRIDENIAQTENSLADLGDRLKSALLKISKLEMENEKVLAKLEKTKNTLRKQKDEYAAIKSRNDENIAQTENSLANSGDRLKSALLKISKLEMENEKVLAKLEKTKNTLRERQDEYAAMKSMLTDNPTFNLAELDKLVEMSPSKRYAKIKSSNLGSKAMGQGGMLATCVKILRDKAKLSSGCKDRIYDFLLLEGW